METELKGVPQPPDVPVRRSGYGKKVGVVRKARPGAAKVRLRRTGRAATFRAVSGFKFLKKIIALIKKTVRTKSQGDFRNHGYKGVKGRSGRTGRRGGARGGR